MYSLYDWASWKGKPAAGMCAIRTGLSKHARNLFGTTAAINGHIPKPIEPEILYRALNRAMNNYGGFSVAALSERTNDARFLPMGSAPFLILCVVGSRCTMHGRSNAINVSAFWHGRGCLSYVDGSR